MLGGTVTAGYRYDPTTTDLIAATTAVASQIATLRTAGASPPSIAVHLEGAFD